MNNFFIQTVLLTYREIKTPVAVREPSALWRSLALFVTGKQNVILPRWDGIDLQSPAFAAPRPALCDCDIDQIV